MTDSKISTLPAAPALVIGTALSVPVLAVTLDLLGVVGLTEGGFPVELSTFADIAGVFGSVLLTLALVLLYSEQTKIQERQEEWMEAEHVPDVFVHEWEITRNRIDLELSNLGTGVARDLRVTVAVETGDRFGLSTVTFTARASRRPSSARVLRPDEDVVTVGGNFVLTDGRGTVDIDDMTVEDALQWLNDGESTLAVDAKIEYDYVRRRSRSRQLFTCAVDSSDSKTVEDLFVSADWRAEDRPDTIPKSLE